MVATRASSAKTLPEGIQFPLSNAETGERSTTVANSGTFAASVKGLDKEMAESISNEGRKWRRRYTKYVVKNVELSVKSPKNALAIAKAGLEHMHSNFDFVRDGQSMKLKEAMKKITGSFETGMIKGKKPRPVGMDFEVPYTKYGTTKGSVLKGDALLIQIEQWVSAGVIEPSCGEAMSKVVTNKEWLDLSDKHFVLLGAGSAMGPLLMLLSLGANIIAIDYHAAPIWKRLTGLVEDSCGTMIFPMKKPQAECKDMDEICANAGCDLFVHTPEVRTWLVDMDPKIQMVIGAYAYMDGEKFVRISLSMDAIIQDVVQKRNNVSIAYLCTPTDAHVVPAASVDWCKKKMRRVAKWWHPLVTMASGGKQLARNARKPITSDDGDEFFVCDAIVNQQGPNYILAKRLQHWRAIISREEHGCTVSSNIAPSTATLSVVSNLSFKIAYGGFQYYSPMEVFLQDTSNAVMGALLIHDVRNDSGAAHPDTRLRNPLELFTYGSFHGGAWRCPYKFGSIGTVAAVTYVFMEFLVKAYLLGYNVAQAGGWGLGLYRVIQHAQSPSSGTIWDAASIMGYFQMWTMLEVAHSALGFVRASALTTFLQIFSRVFVVSVVMQAPQVQDIWSVWLFALAWSITEVVRYSFYALNLFKVDVAPLTFLRYTMFLLLYPLGVLGEVVTVYSAVPHLKTLLMGPLGFTTLQIDYGMWCRYLVGPVYCLGLPFLYTHMLAQRKKVLGGGKKKGGGGKSKKE